MNIVHNVQKVKFLFCSYKIYSFLSFFFAFFSKNQQISTKSFFHHFPFAKLEFGGDNSLFFAQDPSVARCSLEDDALVCVARGMIKQRTHASLLSGVLRVRRRILHGRWINIFILFYFKLTFQQIKIPPSKTIGGCLRIRQMFI